MTLAHVSKELEPGWYQSTERDVHGRGYVVLSTPRGALSCRLIEEHQRHSLLVTTGVALHLRLPQPVPSGERITLLHSGWIWRGDLTFRRGPQSLEGLAQRLCASVGLQEAVRRIDFTRFELVGEGGSVCVQISLYGACEVRCRLPPMRCYVRMGTEQARALRVVADLLASAAMGLT